MRVLIAEDNAATQEMLAAVLSGSGYDVVATQDGREALKVIREGDVRLIITDWEMPYLNGVDLCRAVRADDQPGYIYIILITSHNTLEERLEGLGAGADDFIGKPFNTHELLARIRIGERILSLETREIAIFAMAKLAESRDPETGAHLERVRCYSRLLAQNLASVPKYRGLVDSEFIRLIYLTSPLHDIGKVGIPDSVLLKPGRLSDREFDVMKSHTVIGAQTLDAAVRMFPTVKFLQMGRDIAISHHERFDGTGYPAGLVGDRIPLAGRIVALADVYDALTSKRVYKNAMHHDVARAMIVAESGTHFDPDIVQAFLGVEGGFIATRERYDEALAAAA